MDASPYKFLAPYDERDERIFFGREREIEILLADVVVGRLVVLFAKTGTGKTSLINAGVRPILQRRGYRTYFVRVRRDPAQSVRDEIRRHLDLRFGDDLSFAAQMDVLARELKQPVVVFFDQFEEFFLDVAREDAAAAQAFIADVAKIFEDETSGVHIVFSMREEFFVEMDMFRDEIPTIFHEDSNLRLRWFDADQARAAIAAPAQAFGVVIEPALVDRLIADLTKSGQLLAGATPSKPIEPAQLQIVCDTLWRQRAPKRRGAHIKLAHYRALGRPGSTESIAQQILDQRLKEEFAKISDKRQLELLERLLPVLRTERGTKRVWNFQSLLERLDAGENDLHALLDQLARSHLIPRSPRDAADFVELTHDYLVERLPDLRRGVRAIVGRRVVEEVSELARGSPDGLLDVNGVMSVLDRSDEIELEPDEGILLLRSALQHGIDLRNVLDLVERSGAPAWTIIQEHLDHGDERQAGKVVELLAKLASAEALSLLTRTFDRASLANRALTLLASKESVEAVRLFAQAIERPALRNQAQAALELAVWSSNPDVASAAERALELAAETSSRPSAGSPPPPIEIDRPVVQPARSRRWRRESDGEPSAADSTLRRHFRLVAGEILTGRVVPFLGMGVNLCGRPEETPWRPEGFDWLPSERELSNYLAQLFDYADKNAEDLVRVSQYVSLVVGSFPLYAELRRLFDADYPPTALHRVLAEVPSMLRRNRPDAPRYQLIVTTNYDDVLERAFHEAGEPFDLVTYEAHRGTFTHRPPRGEPRTILQPNAYYDLTTDERTVILKLHGAVDRADESRDSYVITEDQYIDYLARTDVSKLFPVTLMQLLRHSHCLFLGYSLRDWNLRVILNRLWGEESLRAKSWAVQSNPDRLDKELWNRRDVMLLDLPLENYIAGLRAALLAPIEPGGR